MSTPWAVRLPAASAPAAGALRLRPGVRVREAGDWLWLRGDDLTEELDLELRKIPGALRHTVNVDETVTEVDHRIPADELPPGDWAPLSQWLSPRPQVAAMAGAMTGRAPLTVRRATGERPATVLVTTADVFADYASTAPAIRLRPLRFAAAPGERVILWGDPLPPLPGTRCAETGGVAVPCGYELAPALDSSVLRALLNLADGDLALFDPTCAYEHVAATSFTRATRAAARATAAALQHKGAAP